MEIVFIILAVLVILVFWLIFIYNKFVTLTQRVKEAWSDIEVQMKRRYDLIPNLVNTVKGYAAHESGTLEKVVEARNNAMNAKTTKEHSTAENDLSSTLKSIFALSESYPDLKANENFLELQKELADTENKIQSARRFYNTNVRDLNTAVLTFPGNFIANSFNFQKMDFFDIPDDSAAQQTVAVQF